MINLTLWVNCTGVYACLLRFCAKQMDTYDFHKLCGNADRTAAKAPGASNTASRMSAWGRSRRLASGWTGGAPNCTAAGARHTYRPSGSVPNSADANAASVRSGYTSGSRAYRGLRCWFLAGAQVRMQQRMGVHWLMERVSLHGERKAGSKDLLR